MPKPVLIVKNISHEGPGLLETAIARHGMESLVRDLSKGEPYPDPSAFSALVVLGGPASANDETPAMMEELRLVRKAVTEGIPFLGICLGMQALVKAAGGRVVQSPVKETGFFAPDGSPYMVDLTDAGMTDPLFAGLGRSFRVFQLHGETVEPFYETTDIIGTGNFCPVQAVRCGSNAYGLQCHFELTREMFAAWLDLDTDLKTMDRSLLLRQFEDFREEYTATGLRLMENFLRIAGLA
jgi:GMP synthase (glutamine-hydrolysing)